MSRFPSPRLLPLALLAVACWPALSQTIRGTKHDLSTSGPGPVKSTSETEICKFCHTPHSAQAQTPLWNRNFSTASYVLPTSATLDATLNQPTGSSKLCLSCHDGQLALGQTFSGPPIPMPAAYTRMPPGSSNMGTDLSGHHPISFRVDLALINKNNTNTAGGMKLKTTVGEMQRNPVAFLVENVPDESGNVQCTSCHDPHRDTSGSFLRTPLQDSICLACHSTPN